MRLICLGDPEAVEDNPHTDEPDCLAADDPDLRFTYANERTLLAWNRTALAPIATGVAGTTPDGLETPIAVRVRLSAEAEMGSAACSRHSLAFGIESLPEPEGS